MGPVSRFRLIVPAMESASDLPERMMTPEPVMESTATALSGLMTPASGRCGCAAPLVVRESARSGGKEFAVDSNWFSAALWMALALLASLISIRLAVSVALVEVAVGAVAGNLIGLEVTALTSFLAGVGAVVLTFLAGAEIDPEVVHRRFWASILLGAAGFLVPVVGVLAFTH